MKSDTVITLSRQFASGGRTIGKRLSEELNIPYFDKDLIVMAANESGFNIEFFENAEDRSNSAFMHYMTSGYGNVSSWGLDMALNDKIFLAQADVIRKLAEQGSCIIIGRCADYVLQNHPGLIKFFIHSDIDNRVERAKNDYHLTAPNLKDAILKSDKKRATYHNYYSDKKWGLKENYDLMINSDSIGIENTVKLLADYVRMRKE